MIENNKHRREGYYEYMLRRYKEESVKDRHVETVCDKFRSRMDVGYKKYGVTTERNDIDLAGWLNHLQEELMDAIVYIQRLKSEVEVVTIQDIDPANRTWYYDGDGHKIDKETGRRVYFKGELDELANSTTVSSRD